MIWAIAVPLLALVAVLQSAVLRQIQFAGGNLDLLFLIILCWSMLRPTEGLVWAALGGLFADLLSGGPFGSMVSSHSSMRPCYSYSSTSRRVARRSG